MDQHKKYILDKQLLFFIVSVNLNELDKPFKANDSDLHLKC